MSKTILLVEDYEDSRQMLRHFLQKLGYDVAEVGDGLSAVDFVAENSPDLILTDVALPGIDGLEAARRIKAITPQVPIICITAYQMAFAKHAFEAGCVEILSKPVDLRKLPEIIQRYLPDK